MNFLSNPLVARLLWAGPLLLLVIALLLLRAGLAQRDVAARGTTVEAEVLGMDVRERSEITHASVRLRFTPPGASASVERTVELPLAFVKELEADSARSVPIRVLAGTDQIALARHERSQWIMSLAFAGMALMGALGLAWMVGAWNRLLTREGDPATRAIRA